MTQQAALDKHGPVPLYAQLDEILRSRIASGEWAAGMMVPSENAIARQYGISRMTARGVLNSLADEGLLVRVPGKGTLSPSRRSRPGPPRSTASEPNLRRRVRHHHPAGARRAGAATPRLARQLEVPPETELSLIERVRSVDGEPISLHRSWVPTSLASDLIEADVVGEQLCTILARDHHLRATRVTQQLESVPVTEADAELLGLAPGQPVLVLEDTTSNQHGPYEFSRITFRGDRIRLGFTFDLTNGEVRNERVWPTRPA